MINGHAPEMRMASLEDVEWIAALGQKEMPSLVRDVRATEAWLADLIANRKAFIARSDHAFVIAHISSVVFDPESRPLILHTVCGDRDYPQSVWELLKLAQATLNWGRINGATLAKMESSTGADVAPIASRLGFTEITPRYSMEL